MGIGILDFIVIIIYFVAILAIGVYTTKRIKNFDDSAVVGRSLPAVLIFGTVSATVIGGAATLGRVGEIHDTGLVIVYSMIVVVFTYFISGWFLLLVFET